MGNDDTPHPRRNGADLEPDPSPGTPPRRRGPSADVKLLQRIALALGSKPATAERGARAPEAGEPEGRRRRRGGRGRGRGGSGANGVATSAPSPTTDRSTRTEAPARDTRDTRDAARRDAGRSRPRWQRPPAHLLEQPLPEDVAFRPVAEGGDSSIVPARRRRASRAGERVFPIGNVPYVARTHEDTSHANGLAPRYAAVEDDGDRDEDEAVASRGVAAGDGTTDGEGMVGEGERKRRRRGRRGGRGRRRPPPEGTPDSTAQGGSGGTDAVA